MSRSDQYIGLTQDALKWVEKAISKEEIVLTTNTLCDEPITGYRYHMPPPEGPNKAYIAEETIQITPWSSGPMYFTHLKITLVKEDWTWKDGTVEPGQVLECGTAFDWTWNPGLEQETDHEKGQFNV